MIRLSEYFTASGGGTSTEDAFGSINVSPVTFNFWGNVSENKSNRIVQEGRRYDVRSIKVIARADDIEDLTIDHTLTFEGESNTYVVTDIYEAEYHDRGIESAFKSYKTILATYRD